MTPFQEPVWGGTPGPRPAPLASRRWLGSLLAAFLLCGCGSSARPPRATVESIARGLFERAAKGEAVPVRIPLTGQGPAEPRLTRVEVLPRPRSYVEGREVYEYHVRLEYLNRIQQLESASFLVRLEQKDGAWQTSFPEVPAS